MTSSLRHKTKFWGLFLQIPKVQLNIYRMVVWNKLYLEWFRSYSHFKMSNFGGRDSRERESGTVTFHVSLFKCPGWKFVGKVWNFCVLLLDDVTSWWMFKWRSGALARAQTYPLSTIRYHFCNKHRKSGNFRDDIKATNYDHLKWNLHSCLELPWWTYLASFMRTVHPEIAVILVRKSGFL